MSISPYEVKEVARAAGLAKMADEPSTGLPAYCNFITAATPWPCIQATLQYGDNGPGPTPEFILNAAQGQLNWAPLVGSIFDSDWHSVELDVGVGSGSRLSIARGAGGMFILDDSVTYGYIQDIQIYASVSGARRRFEWDAVAVRLYRGNELRQTMARPPECQPKANTYDVPAVGWQGVQYTPTASDNDRVVVTGRVRHQADAPIYQPWELLGRILVFAADCTGR